MNLTYCGLVALVGRPNVGKSTLLNQLIGQKLSITSRKPQTTRTRILGIDTEGAYQSVYVDTPGLNQAASNALNRRMNRAVINALEEVTVVVFMVDGLHWNEGDVFALEAVKKAKKPTLLLINKVDLIKNKDLLLPHIEMLTQSYPFLRVLLISAKKRLGLESLKTTIHAQLPSSSHFYAKDELTNCSSRFVAAEFVREQLIRSLGDELPYSTAVTIDTFKQENKILHLHATIWVERDGQKAIVIGKKGEKLKQIGTSARHSLEKFFDGKVCLKLWVKVKSGWGNNEQLLQMLDA